MTPEPASVTIGAKFDKTYYAVGLGAPYERNAGWLDVFGRLADRIVADMQPATVLDAGCAMGFLVEALRARGVEAWGVDISDYAIGQVHASVRNYCRVGSITESFGRQYDLITCIEVLEHLPKADGERAVENLCTHTDDVLFSSSPNDFVEATHFNVQPGEYWAEQFARHGFYRDLNFDATFIAPWAVRFRRSNEPVHRVVRGYEQRMRRLDDENAQLRCALNEARATIAKPNDDAQRMLAERDALRDLVHRYEQGKFMRFTRWLARLFNNA